MTVYRVVRASDTVIADTDGQVSTYDKADDRWEPREPGGGGSGGGSVSLIDNGDGSVTVVGGPPGEGEGADPEFVRDTMAAALVAGTGISITPDDGADTITIAATGSGGGTTPDATTTTKGIVQLAGDLGGTADVPTVPGLADKADASHTHNASDVDSGTLAIARIPTGTTGSTVALGNHTHTPASIGAAPASHTHGAADLSGVVKTVNGTAPDGAGNVVVAGGGSAALPRFGLVPVLGPTTRVLGNLARAWVPLNPHFATPVASAQIGNSAGDLSGLPLSLPRPIDYKSHAIRVATSEAGATLRWGLYGVDADGMPTGHPVLDSGSIALDATGQIITAQTGTVPAGDYWLLAVVSSLVTARVQGWADPWQMSIQGASPGGTGFAFQFGTATATAALPDVSTRLSSRTDFSGRGAVAVMIGGAP